jgi:hypothetical protein
MLFTNFREAWSLRQAILSPENLVSVRVGSEISATGRGCKLESTPRFEFVYNREREGELKLDTAIDDRGQGPCRTRSAAESISLVALETVGTKTSAKRI